MRTEKILYCLAITALLFVGAYYGKTIIIPFIMALVIWLLVIGVSNKLGKIKIRGRQVPEGVRIAGAFIVLLLIGTVIGTTLTQSISNLIGEFPKRYNDNINTMALTIAEKISHIRGVDKEDVFQRISKSEQIFKYVESLANTIYAFAGNVVLIIIYLVFLVIEYFAFPVKMKAMFPNRKEFAEANSIIKQIGSVTQTYITLKTSVSLLTAVVSYLLLIIIGVDFAVFWAFLIFLFNYIPSIGSIIATVFPSLMALIQFESFNKFIIVLVGVGAVQMIVGNYIEPRITGDRLNISPLVVMLSLALFGALWGIMGMFLCVPLTVIIILILAQFEDTQKIAMLLSSNGKIPAHKNFEIGED
ncbi:MAG: AI-2E family transporter [Bacteroidales bacterium]